MHSKSNNIEFMPYDNANEVVNEPLESLLSIYQNGLETLTRGSDFIIDSVQLLYYKCQRINFKRGGPYIDSPDRIKEKKATINLKNEDENVFQYAATVALNHGKTKKDPQKISRIKPFINKCNWTGTKHPSTIYEWKTLE